MAALNCWIVVIVIQDDTADEQNLAVAWISMASALAFEIAGRTVAVLILEWASKKQVP